MWHKLGCFLRTLAKFACLTIAASVSLAISILINYAALAAVQIQLRLFVPGFDMLASGHSRLASVIILFCISGP